MDMAFNGTITPGLQHRGGNGVVIASDPGCKPYEFGDLRRRAPCQPALQRISTFIPECLPELLCDFFSGSYLGGGPY